MMRAKEIVEEKGKVESIHSSRGLASLVETAVSELANQLLGDHLKGPGDPKGPGLVFQSGDEPNLALILGTYCEDEPCLYTVHSEGVTERKEGYASVGSGSALAEYLLTKLYRSALTLDQAIRMAVFVVEEVRKAGSHSYGPTRVVVVRRGGIERKTEAEIIEIVKWSERCDQMIKAACEIVVRGPKEQRSRRSRTTRAQRD